MARPAVGMLLIASPVLADPHFMRTVVYLLDHNDEGTLGLIVNRPLEIPLKEIWDHCPDEIDDLQICAEGGPVERERGLLLHGRADVSGCNRISEGVFIGGDPYDLYQKTKDADRLHGPRLFLGHAGWGGGQLQDEIETGSWRLRPGHPDLLLNAEPPEDLWQELITCGPEMPPPSSN